MNELQGGRMVKILFVLAASPGTSGGAEVMVKTLAAGLPAGRYEYYFIYQSRGVLAEELGRLGTVILLDIPGKLDLFAAFRLARVIKRYKIDIVHSHQPRFDLYSVIAARFCGIRSVVTRHSSIYDFRIGGLARRAYLLADYFTLLLADSVIKVSRSVRMPFSARVIYNASGIKTPGAGIKSGLPGLDDRDTVILTVGQLKMEKGFSALKEIAGRFEKRAGVKFIVAGDGEDRDKILKMFEEPVKKGQVIFTGYAADPGPYYSRADLFLLPSLREGFPLALLEAQAAGLPCVATDTGGVGEIIKEGESGYLVKTGDVAGFAEKIEKLLDDPLLYRRMAAGARSQAEKFSLSRMTGEYDEAYCRVMKKKNLALSPQGAGNTLLSFEAAAAYCAEHPGEVFDYCLYGFQMDSFIEEFPFAGRVYKTGGGGFIKSLSSLAVLVRLMLTDYNVLYLVYPNGVKTKTLAKMFRYRDFLYRDYKKGPLNYREVNMEIMGVKGAGQGGGGDLKPSFAEHERLPAVEGMVGIHPGSGGGMSYKRWPAEKYLRLIKLLLSRGLKPVVFTGPQDKDVMRLFQNIPGVLTCHGLSLHELYLKVLACGVFITGDTFLLHFADLCGVPKIIALYGPTDQAVTLPSGRVTAVSRRPGCRPCYSFTEKGECRSGFSCLADITPEEIIELLK